MFTERPVTAADAPWIVALFRLPHAQPFMQQPDEATVLAVMGRDDLVERIVLDAAGAPVGLWRAGLEAGWCAELKTVAVATPAIGAGTWIVRRALAWAFEERRVHRTMLYVTAANVRARALYERHGFQWEGTERDGFRNAAGTFEDLCHYGMLDGDYARRSWGHE